MLTLPTDLQGWLDLLQVLLTAFLTFGGVNIFITAVVNVLKYLKVVADGAAPTWTLILNAALFVVYVITQFSGLDFTGIDTVLMAIGNLILALLPMLGGLLIGRGAHYVLRRFNVPVLGFSYSR